MVPPRKRARTAVDAVWDKYWAVVEMKQDARRLVEKASHLHAALTHSAWEEVSGVCQTMDSLAGRRKAVLQHVQSLTLAELRASPQTAVVSLRHDYGIAVTSLGSAKDKVGLIIEGIPMRHTYPAMPESEDELLGQYRRMEQYARCTVAMDRFAALHTGLSGDMVEELRRRVEGVSDVLGRELEIGGPLYVSGWTLKAALRSKIQNMDTCIKRCVRATAELDHALDIASNKQMVPTMPLYQCYVCLCDYMFGLSWCTQCVGALCSGCVPPLVAHACDSGGVAAFNGEATQYA